MQIVQNVSLPAGIFIQQNMNNTVLPLFSQSDTFLTTHQNAAQRVLDGMNYMIQTVSEYSTGPTKAVTAWLTDQVAPPYWRPNTEITVRMKTQQDSVPLKKWQLMSPCSPLGLSWLPEGVCGSREEAPLQIMWWGLLPPLFQPQDAGAWARLG